MKAPRVPTEPVEPLTDDELRALIRTCAVPDDVGSAETLHHRRDEAIIRLMFETAIRSGELVDLQLDDVDLIGRPITIRRGKGGRGRVIPVGPTTIDALLAYLDERVRHRLAPHARPLARQSRQAVRSRRTQPVASSPRRQRRSPRVPTTPTQTHRGPPMARRRRIRVRAHGHRGLDPHRHAGA